MDPISLPHPKHIRRLLTLTAIASACGPSYAAPAPTADPFAWLEPQHDPAAVNWARERTQRAMDMLKASPNFPAVRSDLQSALRTSAPLPNIFILGSRFIRFERSEAFPEGLLQTAPLVQGTAPTAWTTILDIAALNRREHSAYVMNSLTLWNFPARCLTPKYDRCMLPLSSKGSSSLELREFDIAHGVFVDGGFSVPANRDSTAWLDDDTLAIAHSLEGSPALPSSFPAVVRLWKRGTPLAAAKPVFTANPTDSLVEIEPLGSGASRRLLIKAVRDYLTIDYKVANRDGSLHDLPLPRKIKYVGSSSQIFPYIVFQVSESTVLDGTMYPAETIVAYNTDGGTGSASRFTKVYSPLHHEYVNDAAVATSSRLAFIRTTNLRRSLMLGTPTRGGWRIRESYIAQPGETLSILPGSPRDDGLLLKEEGFLTPPTISWMGSDAPKVAISTSAPIIDASKYVVDIRSARSKDGTQIDYYLVHPKTGTQRFTPTLIGGYGAFGANYDPKYFGNELGLTMASWLRRGGAFAATALRGGGERGAAWQVAGSGVNKQNTFDDFAAVAQGLIRSGFTATSRIGAFGRSSGGLLTAAAVTQHPELYGAVYIGVPVTDLAQMTAKATGIVRGQKSEFGNWDDPNVFNAIMRYSPYQNIRNGVTYPPVLLVTSTEDNQVGPAHARKFAAKLESVGAQPLLIEDPEGGHGVPDAFKQPDLAAAQMVFFMDKLMK